MHAAHRMSPFEVVYGYRPDFTVPVGPPTKFPALNSRLQQLQETHKEAEAALCMEKQNMKQTFEAHKPQPHTFCPGDKVWLSSKDILTSFPSQKLMPHQLRPYKVLDRPTNLTYRLLLPPSMHQHPVFHVDRLSPWTGNSVNGHNPPPPEPIQIDNETEYKAEQILDSHKYRNQYQYLVKWRGYDPGHNSWEPATNLTHSQDLVNSFHAQHPSAPRQLSATIFASLHWQPQHTFTTTPPCPPWEAGIVGTVDVIHKKGVM